MNSEIICVGTELLMGNTVNTNATYLSQKCSEAGIYCYYHSVVGDNDRRIREALEIALSRSDLILITGGLGPTYDDRTKEVVAESCGLKLIRDEAYVLKMKDYFKQINRECTENNLKQADMIEGALVLLNERGTAPGFIVKHQDKTIVLLPGPPFELYHMFEHQVLPYLEETLNTVLVSDWILLSGIGESKVEQMIHDEIMHLENPTIAPYADPDLVKLRITSRAFSEAEGKHLNRPWVDKLAALFDEYLVGKDVQSLEESAVKLLREKRKKVAVAESCTGGLLSQRITSIAGSSEVFDLGLVTYANTMKMAYLGVSSEVLAEKGAVSKEVAKVMAESVRKRAQADYGIGITGVAGPGFSENKPVGLVYIGIASKDRTEVIQCDLARRKDRNLIQKSSTSIALKALIDELRNLKS